MLRKILLVLTMAVMLVTLIAVLVNGPPELAMLPPVMTVAVCPLVECFKTRTARL